MPPQGGKGRGPPPGLPPGLEDAQVDSRPQGNSNNQRPGDQMQSHISDTIGSQVRQMISQAKNDSEVKVKRELGKVHTWIRTMDEMLDNMLAHLDKTDGPKVEVDSATVSQLLAQIEQQWTKELSMLKQELHQTILAHNHNADLMKHQKDMLETVRQQLEQIGQADQIDVQLQKVDVLLKGQPKQKKLEPLFARLAALEQRVATSFAMQMSRPAFPMVPPSANLAMVPPGALVPPGTLVPPGVMAPGMGLGPSGPNAAAPGLGGGQKASKSQKGSKANDKNQKNDRSEKAKGNHPKSDADNASYKRPTDEELHERLNATKPSKDGKSSKDQKGREKGLNKEAPAYVPDTEAGATKGEPARTLEIEDGAEAKEGSQKEQKEGKEGKAGKNTAKPGNSKAKDEEASEEKAEKDAETS